MVRTRRRRLGILRVAIACAAVALTSASTALGLSLAGVTAFHPATAAASSSSTTSATTVPTSPSSTSIPEQVPASTAPTFEPTTEPPTTIPATEPTVLECPFDGGPCIAAASCDSSSYQCQPLTGNGGGGYEGRGSGRFHHGGDRSFGQTNSDVSDN